MFISVAACLVWRMMLSPDVADEITATGSGQRTITSASFENADPKLGSRTGQADDSLNASSNNAAENKNRNDSLSARKRMPSSDSPTSAERANTASGGTSVAFDDVRRRNFQLELPGRGDESDFNEVKLAALPLAPGETLQLALSGGGGSNCKLSQKANSPPDAPVWTVVKQAQAEFGAQEEVVLGQFVHRTGELCYQWNADAPLWAKSGSLRFVPLEVTVGAERQVCQLWKSLQANPTRFGTQAATTIDVPLPGNMIDRPKAFHVGYQLAETDKAERTSAAAALGETAKMSLGDEQQIEVELRFVIGEQTSSIQVRLYGTPPLMKDGHSRGPRREISPTFVEEHLRQAKSKDPKKREAEIARLQTQQAKLQKQMTSTKSNRGAAELEMLEKQIESIDAKIAKLETDRANMEQIFETNVEWCQKVAGILRNLEDRSQLGYTIYLDTEPRTVVIETSGYDWKK